MKIRLLLLFLFIGTFSFAQEKKDTTSGAQPTGQVFESKQSVMIDGKTISLTYLEAGHRMYTPLPSAKLFREDLKKSLQTL